MCAFHKPARVFCESTVTPGATLHRYRGQLRAASTSVYCRDLCAAVGHAHKAPDGIWVERGLWIAPKITFGLLEDHNTTYIYL